MKGISKADKAEFIRQVTATLSKRDGRGAFLRLKDYNGAKKLVRRVDEHHCGRLVDNGHHFLDVMTKALPALGDNEIDAKWTQLQEDHRRRKEQKR